MNKKNSDLKNEAGTGKDTAHDEPRKSAAPPTTAPDDDKPRSIDLLAVKPKHTEASDTWNRKLDERFANQQSRHSRFGSKVRRRSRRARY